jgi:hypothetical protein
MLFASASAADFPWAALTPMILAFVVGVVLCLAGRRVMRLAFTAVGFIAGAAIGWIVAQAVDLSVADWVVIVVPAIVMAAIAAIAYKLTIAVVMAVVLGVAAPLAVITAGEIGLYELPSADGTVDEASETEAPAGESPGQDASDEETGLREDVEAWVEDHLKKQVGDAIDDATGKVLGPRATADESEDDADVEPDAHDSRALPFEAQEHVDRAKEFVNDAYIAAKERWSSYPQALRWNLLLSAGIGALLGVLLGALAPGLSASVASAGAGSAICLVSASIVAARLGAAESDWLPTSFGAWLLLWLVIAIIGLAIQWTTRPRPVDIART